MDSSILALPDEQALVANAVAEPAAFAALYDHYFPRVYNYVRYRLRDPIAADDITAQAFERALTHLGSYRPERAPFGAWLFGIVRNTVRDAIRAANRRRWLSLSALSGHPSGDPPLEVQTARSLWRQQLLAAVSRLGERDQELIALRFGAGLSNIETARLLGITPNNAAVALNRALARLRSLLGPDVALFEMEEAER